MIVTVLVIIVMFLLQCGFAVNQIRLVEGKRVVGMLFPHEAKQPQPFVISKI